MPLEWGTGLCCFPQYCQVGYGVSAHLSRDLAVPGVPHERVEGLSQAYLIYWGRRGSTVAAAGDHTPPEFRQTCLLCRMVSFHRVTHLSAYEYPRHSFYVSTEKAFALACVMFRIITLFCNGCSCFRTSLKMQVRVTEYLKVTIKNFLQAGVGGKSASSNSSTSRCYLSYSGFSLLSSSVLCRAENGPGIPKKRGITVHFWPYALKRVALPSCCFSLG